MARVHIGTSGWHYPHWVGNFYPQGMPLEQALAFYSRSFASVEINGTFYRLPPAGSIAKWRQGTPDGFVFACKASRYITHMKKLTDPAVSTAPFFAAIEALKDKLGPILFQLPPRWSVDLERLRHFLRTLPHGRRYAFEFRDRSWFVPELRRLLEEQGAACCAYDFGGWRSPVLVTADFVYIRLHGPGDPYRGGYDGRTLAGWSKRMAAWRRAGLDVYCYFDNDDAGHAARDALRLAGMLREGALS